MVGYNTTITLIAKCPVEHYLNALVNMTYGVNYRRILNFCSPFFILSPHFDEMLFSFFFFFSDKIKQEKGKSKIGLFLFLPVLSCFICHLHL